VAGGDGNGVNYLSLDDYFRAAASALGAEQKTVAAITDHTLAGSALAVPAAGFSDHEEYPEFATKAAVLLQAVASNHALPDGNKRTALLCSVLFANLNGYRWIEPEGDDPDGAETAEIVEAGSTRSVPLPALAAWVGLRLVPVAPPLPESLSDRPPLVIYPAEYVGALNYADNIVQVGEISISDVHGYNPAGVYVRRISGKTDGISVAEISISFVGDGYAQEELDAENAEAERYPLGQKEFWRTRLVGKATHGIDSHPMTDAEFQQDWAEGEHL
jgi:death-on-curing protein